MDDYEDSPFRARSNTWPLPRPDLQEDLVYGSPSSEENEASDHMLKEQILLSNHQQLRLSHGDNPNLLLLHVDHHSPESGLGSGETVIPTTAHEVATHLNRESKSGSSQQLHSPVNGTQLNNKKNTSRRNAWGNMSYADLITQAIQGSPDKRLTLSQIYEWMVQNVPYFKDKGDSNSSAGWKNSIRHNLSLHNRFMRVQNEGTGKSSWWMINPDAKPGKAARRRATSMETSKFEKKRGRVKKKVEAMRNGVIPETQSPSSSVSEGLDHFDESPLLFNLSPGEFRARTSSNASSCGRLSPIPAIESDMHDCQVPPLSPLNHWNSSDINRITMYSGETNEPYTDKLVELANTMKLGGNGSTTGSSTGFLSVNNKSSPTTNLSPASSHLTLTPGYSGFGSNLSVNSGGYVNGGAGSNNGSICGGGSGSLSRNGSDPFFQASAGIDGTTITLTSLNALNPSDSRKSPSNQRRTDSSPFLSDQQQHQPSTSSATFSLVSLSPSLSPAQSMDTILSSVPVTRVKQESNNNGSGSSSHSSPSGPTSQNSHSFASRSFIPSSSSCNMSSMSSRFPTQVLLKSESGLSHGSPAPPTASQVMGHLLSLSNSHSNNLPNDLDFDSLQGGLECDVNSVIQHELSVDGNLDFNFDPMHAGNPGSSGATAATTASAASHSCPSWVH